MTLLRLTLSLLLFVCLVPTPSLARKLPGTIVHSPEVLREAQQRILERDPLAMPAYRQLIKDADKALKRSVTSVVFKPTPPPDGTRHDYWSMAPDWWPDPTKRNGLPYIRRDGDHNPEADSERFDRARLQQTADDVLTLALAWYISGNEQYAGKGAALIFSWCCDSVTRMTPHMAFARMRPGERPDEWMHSPLGVIDGRELITIVEAARILEPSHAWGKAVTFKLKKWFEDYIDWMRTSELGVRASALPDHHGTWYDAQLAVFALFTDQEDLARSIVGSVVQRRMIRQVAANGAMVLELERTRSRHYTFSNLAAYFTLAAVGDRLNIDLWHQTEGGVSLRRAFDYAAPYLAADTAWPFGEVGRYDPFRFTPLFHRAAMVYKEDRYRDFLTGLPADGLVTDRAQLFY